MNMTLEERISKLEGEQAVTSERVSDLRLDVNSRFADIRSDVNSRLYMMNERATEPCDGMNTRFARLRPCKNCQSDITFWIALISLAATLVGIFLA